MNPAKLQCRTLSCTACLGATSSAAFERVDRWTCVWPSHITRLAYCLQYIHLHTAAVMMHPGLQTENTYNSSRAMYPLCSCVPRSPCCPPRLRQCEFHNGSRSWARAPCHFQSGPKFREYCNLPKLCIYACITPLGFACGKCMLATLEGPSESAID